MGEVEAMVHEVIRLRAESQRVRKAWAVVRSTRLTSDGEAQAMGATKWIRLE